MPIDRNARGTPSYQGLYRSTHLRALLSVLAVGGPACGTQGPTSSASSHETDTSSETTNATELAATASPEPCTDDEACDDGEMCNGIEKCSTNNMCEVGEPMLDATVCGDDSVCIDGACVTSDCGNAIIEPGEQCDDGNQHTLDGCDASCRYELFYRAYELTLLPSPAASFCGRPTSALADALSIIALAADNSNRKARIDTGVENPLFQILHLDDLTGGADATIEFRRAMGLLDPARGTWPDDKSNPLDWWFLVLERYLDNTGALSDQIPEVSLTNGSFVGGPGVNTGDHPQFINSAVRGHFDTEVLDAPNGPPAMLAEGVVVPREIVADGEDEGICGALTVSYMASVPIEPTLVDCLECPGRSAPYVACVDGIVTSECNSIQDSLIGGCLLGSDCESATLVIVPTPPDVDSGGPDLVIEESNGFYKVPSALTDSNRNGYSSYFRFRARRVHVTGTQAGP